MKTHEGRFHQEFAPKREMSNKADYSIGGLLQCRFCRQSFSRWTALQRHIRNNRCPGLRSTQLGQAGSVGPSDVPQAGPDPGPGVADVGPLWCTDESLPKNDLHPVIKWESVLQLPQPRRWEQIVKLPQVVDYLRQRCGLCGIAKTNGVRKHLQEVHRSEWELHKPRIEHWARSWSKVITRPCPVCAATVVDIRQHAALIQLCLAGPS